MSQLIKIADWGGDGPASVIFVHGLGGNAYTTWRRKGDDASFWPLWLAKDVGGLAVYTLAYEAPATDWLSTAMPLPDRAVNVLEILLSEPGLRAGRIFFICHSLGGLVVKQIMLDMARQKERRPEAAQLLERVTGIVFAATPHTGSQQASLIDRLRLFAWPTSLTRMLVANDPTLRAINVAYRELADDRRDTLRHRVFYETYGTPLGVIVDEASADPGLPGDPPVPIDADHISIVKPADRSAVLYARTRDFLAKASAVQGADGAPARALELFPLPPLRVELPINLIPKIIRVAAILLLGLLLFKGLQSVITPSAPVSRAEFEDVNKKLDRLLTGQLIANSVARPPPGAEQALATTVANTAKAAEAGDAAKRRALELLKANKVDEAADIYGGIADDKAAIASAQKAAARQSDKDAAAAYRDLGAVAALRDTKRARDAYAKAVELDPQDPTGLAMNGWSQLQAQNVAAAEKSFLALLALAGAGVDELDRTNALLGLGSIAQIKGDPDGALAYFQRAESATQRYRESGGTSLEARRHFADVADVGTDMMIGDALFALQRYEDAQEAYQAGAAIAVRRQASEPDQFVWRAVKAGFIGSIGGVLVKQNKLDEALKSYQDALAAMESLAELTSISAYTRSGNMTLHQKIGDVLSRQSKWEEARSHFEAARALAERLGKEDEGNMAWQSTLATLYGDIADSFIAEAKWDEALGYIRDNNAAAARVAKANPSNFDSQIEYVQSYLRMAMTFVRAARVQEATDAIAKGRQLVEQLVAEHPDNTKLKKALDGFQTLAVIQQKWTKEHAGKVGPKKNIGKKRDVH